MGKIFEEITPELSQWIEDQRLFFVGSAPLQSDGHINCSPKGMDTFRILGKHEVAYLDLTGSGAETLAHVRENGRLVFMFCALSGPPKIVRLHGHGTVVTNEQPEFEDLARHFPQQAGSRSIIRCQVTRVSDSCGYGVPRYEYVGERDVLTKWVNSKDEAGLEEYRQQKNAVSIDGLPGWHTATTSDG